MVGQMTSPVKKKTKTGKENLIMVEESPVKIICLENDDDEVDLTETGNVSCNYQLILKNPLSEI
jgi:hypothetical protein